MIDRYLNEDLAQIWSLSGYRDRLVRASYASAYARGDQTGKDIGKQILDLNDAGELGLSEWIRLESLYDHDIAAWVELVRSGLNPECADAWHRDRTSSDLVDTALGLGLRASHLVLERLVTDLLRELSLKAWEHRNQPIMGMTHGQPAEWTSVGRRFAIWAENLEDSWLQVTEYRYGKLSGPVGNWTAGQEFTALQAIGLEPVASTQIVPRSLLAVYFAGLAALSVPVSDLATQIRLGSRGYPANPTAVREVPTGTWCREGRPKASEGQERGSSAMPQKRNPIRSERVTGMSRLVRSNCFAVIESCAGLWEERDLSHSSVERVALVDALHALAFCLTEMTRVVRDLEVLPIELTSRGIEVPTGVGALEVLMDDGMSYTDAYRLVRERGLVDALNSRDKPNWRLAAEFNQSRFGGIGRGAVSVTGANLWGGVKERIGIDQ